MRPRYRLSSPYADYWLVTHAAAAGEVEVIERPLSSYRLHSSNMSFGAQGAQRVRECKRELAIRRLIISSDVSDALSVGALVTHSSRLGALVGRALPIPANAGG